MHIKKVQCMRYSVFIIVEAPLPKMCSFFLSIFEVLSQQHTHCSIFLNLGNFVKSPCTLQKKRVLFCAYEMTQHFLKPISEESYYAFAWTITSTESNKGPLLKKVLIYLISNKL